MYRRTPTGDYLVGVCTNTLCAVMGGDAILEALKDHLGVGNGETTDDGKVTLEHIECNAACDYAPVVMVNWEFFDNQTPSSATRARRRPARRPHRSRPPAARRCAPSRRPRGSWPASPTTPGADEATASAAPRSPGCGWPRSRHDARRTPRGAAPQDQPPTSTELARGAAGARPPIRRTRPPAADDAE